MKYDVRCYTCGIEYEVDHKMGEDHPPCVECGSVLKTIIRTRPLHFKGEGWSGEDAKEDYKLERIINRN